MILWLNLDAYKLYPGRPR